MSIAILPSENLQLVCQYFANGEDFEAFILTCKEIFNATCTADNSHSFLNHLCKNILFSEAQINCSLLQLHHLHHGKNLLPPTLFALKVLQNCTRKRSSLVFNPFPPTLNCCNILLLGQFACHIFTIIRDNFQLELKYLATLGAETATMEHAIDLGKSTRASVQLSFSRMAGPEKFGGIRDGVVIRHQVVCISYGTGSRMCIKEAITIAKRMKKQAPTMIICIIKVNEKESKNVSEETIQVSVQLECCFFKTNVK